MNMSHSSCTVNGGVKPTVACRQQYSPLCQHWEKGGFRDPQLMTAFSVCSLIFVALPIALNTSSSITLLWTVAHRLFGVVSGQDCPAVTTDWLLDCSEHLNPHQWCPAYPESSDMPSVSTGNVAVCSEIRFTTWRNQSWCNGDFREWCGGRVLKKSRRQRLRSWASASTAGGWGERERGF